MSKKQENSVQVTVKIRPNDYEALRKLSAKKHIPMSEIMRTYLREGMSIEKNKDDIDFIRKNIREELDSVMGSYMNRIIKLLLKVGIMTVTMCYFTSQLLFVFVLRDSNEVQYNELLEQSKKKSAVYLGLKDSSIDELTDDFLDIRK